MVGSVVYGSRRRSVCARSLDGVPTGGEEECVYISRGQDGGMALCIPPHRAATHHSLPYKTHFASHSLKLDASGIARFNCNVFPIAMQKYELVQHLAAADRMQHYALCALYHWCLWITSLFLV